MNYTNNAVGNFILIFLLISFFFRLFPIIGQYKISDVAKISFLLHENYGRIVRLGGLIGRPDLLFVYDADEIEKVRIHIFL
jgi:hypothetical protein